MDSGYPTREVVKTASPEMLDLAPKDLPWKIGPFCHRVSPNWCLSMSIESVP